MRSNSTWVLLLPVETYGKIKNLPCLYILKKKQKKLTQQAIADMVGVSRQTLLNWRRAGIDISQGNLPALIDKAAGVEERADTSADIKAARLRILTAQAEKIEYQLAVERGEYMPLAEALEGAAMCGTRSKAAWEAIEDELPPQLEGLTALQMKVKLREYARSKCLELSQAFQIVETGGKSARD